MAIEIFKSIVDSAPFSEFGDKILQAAFGSGE